MTMVIQVLVQALKAFVYFVVGLWRRTLCCFRRRRRISSDSIPLTAIGVVSDHGRPGCSADMDTWNTWDEANAFKPNTIQEHIEMYRQQKIAAQQSVESEEVQQDFFEDMTPRITRQTKLLIDNEDNEQLRNSARLSLAPQPIITPEGELGEWEENSGWEKQTETDWNPETVLREKRRQERERRMWEQQQRRQERVVRPISLGAKIS